MNDNTEEEIYSLNDILIVSNMMEEAEYQRKKGWGDEDKCNYDSGYQKMNVYACLTCNLKENHKVGVCLACSLKCHLDHDIVELYDKRHFRCDCCTLGNLKCDLHDKVNERNHENEYNHNFDGLFCWCNKPYHIEDIMIQCNICKDWYHLECIKEKYNQHIPLDDDEDGDEQITDYTCRTCMEKYPFLKFYRELELNYSDNKTNKENQNGGSDNQDKEESKPFNSKDCKISSINDLIPNDAFFFKGWVSNLCKCENCLKLYKAMNFEWFINEYNESIDESVDVDIGTTDDIAVANDESIKKRKRNDETKDEDIPYSKRSQSLTPYQIGQMAMGYNTLTTQLKNFLSQFAETGKVVDEDDIRDFFKQLKESSNSFP